uniref:Uncharacterized protein n=1 Tax=Triticum urartu TaxID=4572 RepID=A0A8R7PCQ5_TRIUA
MGIATTTIRRNCIAGSEPISRGLWQGAVVVRVLGERHAQVNPAIQKFSLRIDIRDEEKCCRDAFYFKVTILIK